MDKRHDHKETVEALKEAYEALLASSAQVADDSREAILLKAHELLKLIQEKVEEARKAVKEKL